MRLQSKKASPPFAPPLIVLVFILSLAYWLYLSLTTHMDIVFDAISYENLGKLMHTQGWTAYFTTDPKREPLYPLLIALSMRLEHLSGIAFVRIMAFFGVIILFLTQLMSYQILRLLNIRTWVSALVLAYLAISPALNNAAFSLYSEIAAFPLVLGVILTSFYAREAILRDKIPQAIFYGALLGTLLTAVTLVKAVFECITPFYIFFFIVSVFKEKSAKTMVLGACLAATVSFYYVPIISYKCLNLHYNGNYTITNRGPWLIYGNTAQKMAPLTIKKLAESLAYVPGKGVCENLFPSKECVWWYFVTAEKLGEDKQDELTLENVSHQNINTLLLKATLQKAGENPLQFTLMTIREGLIMFFWESTQIGFVEYPSWLDRIYEIKIFNNGLRLILSLLSLIAVVSLWQKSMKPNPNALHFLMGLLLFLYIFFFSFVTVLTRFALPIAPLYLIAIGVWLDQILPRKNQITL